VKTNARILILALGGTLLLTAFCRDGLCDTTKAVMTVTEITGQLEVTKPDGTVMTLSPEDAPAEIPLGSTVTPLTGTARITVTCLIAGLECSATVELVPGSSARISFNEDTGEILIRGLKGKMNVSAREVMAVVEADEEMVVKRDKATGRYMFTSSQGEIDLFSGGAKSTLGEGQSFYGMSEPVLAGEPTEPDPIEGTPYQLD